MKNLLKGRYMVNAFDKNLSSQEWYEKHYSKLNVSGNTESFFHRKLHSLMEIDTVPQSGIRILEVGGNLGEHIPFVKDTWAEYVLTDVREPDLQFQSHLKSINATFKVADVQKLQFDSDFFDRVIATCLFHHIENPLAGFTEMLRVTKPGGKITILIPNDPGLFYTFIHKFTTLQRAKRAGMLQEAKIFHATEHRNHYRSLMTIARYAFLDHNIKFRGYPFFADFYNLNALTVLNVTKVSAQD
jgi:ubiquinone/menaquinone biosynthesis C-methylase UbiE